MEKFANVDRLLEPGPRSEISLLGELAQLAPEDWDYRHRNAARPHPVLWSYLYYSFARLEEETELGRKKIAFAASPEGRPIACFNTGLVTPRQEDIFAYFIRNNAFTEEKRGAIPEWRLAAFLKESDHRLTRFSPRPEIANYFDEPSQLIMDLKYELRLNIDHIMENLQRFPQVLQSNEFAIRNLLEGARVLAIKRVRRNYKTAIPQFYNGKLQLLLPLCLTTPEKADLALVVAKEGEVYLGSTVLSLDMAYNNARLIARPDREWL